MGLRPWPPNSVGQPIPSQPAAPAAPPRAPGSPDRPGSRRSLAVAALVRRSARNPSTLTLEASRSGDAALGTEFGLLGPAEKIQLAIIVHSVKRLPSGRLSPWRKVRLKAVSWVLAGVEVSRVRCSRGPSALEPDSKLSNHPELEIRLCRIARELLRPVRRTMSSAA
jgi:hypothetical protein